MNSRFHFTPFKVGVACLLLVDCLATREVESLQREYANPVNELRIRSHGISIASKKAGEGEQAGMRFYFKGLLRSGAPLSVIYLPAYLKLEERRIEQGDGNIEAVLFLDEPKTVEVLRLLRATASARQYAEDICSTGKHDACLHGRSKLAAQIAENGEESKIIQKLLQELEIVLSDRAYVLLFWFPASPETQTARIEMRAGVPTKVQVEDATWYGRDLEWQIRQKPIYVATYLLYPLAFLVDLVWTPALIVKLAAPECLRL